MVLCLNIKVFKPFFELIFGEMVCSKVIDLHTAVQLSQ